MPIQPEQLAEAVTRRARSCLAQLGCGAPPVRDGGAWHAGSDWLPYQPAGTAIGPRYDRRIGRPPPKSPSCLTRLQDFLPATEDQRHAKNFAGHLAI
jgi:hypothetical protein